MLKIHKKLIQNLERNIAKLAENKNFKHHKWFLEYHLKIVEKISLELCKIYNNADKDLALIMVWMHDYGKIINVSNQYQKTLFSGVDFLTNLGFDINVSRKAIRYIEILDKKENIQKSPIEVQIVSSADGAAHLIGPFFYLWWYENSNKKFKELMNDNKAKMLKDWNKKIVLPEIKRAFKGRYEFLLEQCGDLPKKFLN